MLSHYGFNSSPELVELGWCLLATRHMLLQMCSDNGAPYFWGLGG